MQSQKGQIIYEAALSSLLLIILLLAFMELFSLTVNIIDAHKIAREGAREAALSGDINSGQKKATEYSKQYFKEGAKVSVYTNSSGGEKINVVCVVTKPYKPIKFLDGIEVNVDARAVYPFQDYNK